MPNLHEDPIVRAAVERTALRSRARVDDVWSAARDIAGHFDVDGAELAEALDGICFNGKATQ